jgi:hypothetical protein
MNGICWNARQISRSQQTGSIKKECIRPSDGKRKIYRYARTEVFHKASGTRSVNPGTLLQGKSCIKAHSSISFEESLASIIPWDTMSPRRSAFVENSSGKHSFCKSRMSWTGFKANDGIGQLSSEAVPSVALGAPERGLPEAVKDWLVICRISWIISHMPRSRETSRSSMEGMAALVSKHVDALSWNRSCVSGSSQSSLYTAS